MRHFYRKNAPVLSSMLASLLLFVGGFAMGVEEGDKAPDFSLQSSEIGRAHVRTPVTEKSRMPSSA